MFCVASLESPFSCSFKVPGDEFDELSNQNGFMPAPYLALAKWVLVTNPSKLNKNEWEQYAKRSYELIKNKLTKKLREKLGI
jgi:predicted DNA-binding protein (MmcQ/YjbR family)